MIIEKFREILEKLKNAELDIEKCESGNAAAGRRARKTAMDAIKELKLLRSEILEKSKQ